jgi:hypothetical protein
MDLLRKVYHRAIQIPIEGLDSIWTDFEAFEMGLNKITVIRSNSFISLLVINICVQ